MKFHMFVSTTLKEFRNMYEGVEISIKNEMSPAFDNGLPFILAIDCH